MVLDSVGIVVVEVTTAVVLPDPEVAALLPLSLDDGSVAELEARVLELLSALEDSGNAEAESDVLDPPIDTPL